MKQNSLIFLFILSSLFLFSCSNDDDPSPSNTITIGGQTFTLQTGIITDVGGFTFTDPTTMATTSHYNYDMTIIDGNVLITNSGLGVINTRALISISLFSPGSQGFQAGNFNFVNDNGTFDDIAGNFFFVEGEVAIDLNNDGDADDSGEFFTIDGGSINVTDNGAENYTIGFNITLSDGSTLQTTFTDSFIIIA